MPRDTTKLRATARGGVTTPEWDQAVNLLSRGPFRDLVEDLLGYLDVGLPVSPLANAWMREQSDRAAGLMCRAIEEICRGATALERIAALLERAETSAGAPSNARSNQTRRRTMKGSLPHAQERFKRGCDLGPTTLGQRISRMTRRASARSGRR